MVRTCARQRIRRGKIPLRKHAICHYLEPVHLHFRILFHQNTFEYYYTIYALVSHMRTYIKVLQQMYLFLIRLGGFIVTKSEQLRHFRAEVHCFGDTYCLHRKGNYAVS